ncbi:YdhK family protein [Metaplanococcus flavidus]|uniref:YdhK family protein n=1 Tax=Metaplanococcus flavidus TaxID=569883 RepID=A0ABW3LAM8_9BACL
MLSKKLLTGILSLLFILLLSACNAGNDAPQEHMDSENMPNDQIDQDDGHMGMNHSGSGEVPDGLQEAENPAFEVGSQVNVEADHMSGMNSAEATIVGAYDTTVYAISYTPTDGGSPVRNHKWVIHEELENPGSEPLEAGDEVIVSADHMAGMDGATVAIDSVEETTVYIIDFMPLDDGDQVTNHKWMTEDELSAE